MGCFLGCFGSSKNEKNQQDIIDTSTLQQEQTQKTLSITLQTQYQLQSSITNRTTIQQEQTQKKKKLTKKFPDFRAVNLKTSIKPRFLMDIYVKMWKKMINPRNPVK